MSELNGPGDFLPDVQPAAKVPTGINVLTILTFIGCVLGLFGAVYGFTSAKSNVDKMETAINSPNYENMPALAKKFMSPEALEVARKSYENRVPITLLGLVSTVLCFVGALQMRKLKAQGYTLYVIGEILPLIASAIFLGVSFLTGFTGIISIFFVLLFVLLYTAQRKYLVNK